MNDEAMQHDWEIVHLKDTLADITRFITHFATSYGWCLGVEAERHARSKGHECTLFAYDGGVFANVSYSYYHSHGCLDLLMHTPVTSPDSVRFRGHQWNDYRILKRGFTLQPRDLSVIDTLISKTLIGIHPRNSLRYCSNPHCHNSHNTQWVYYIADRWICESCQNAYLLPAPIKDPVYDPKDPRQIEREKMTVGLRFTILQRDNFQCRACGRNPREHGVTLHVDHIKAIQNGGKTIPDNLQTLCRDCNLAKSDKVIRQMELW